MEMNARQDLEHAKHAVSGKGRNERSMFVMAGEHQELFV